VIEKISDAAGLAGGLKTWQRQLAISREKRFLPAGFKYEVQQR
jgi:hypothetical protein